MPRSKTQGTGSKVLKGRDAEAVTGRSPGKERPMFWTDSTCSRERLQLGCWHMGLGPCHRCLGQPKEPKLCTPVSPFWKEYALVGQAIQEQVRPCHLPVGATPGPPEDSPSGDSLGTG